MGKTTYQDLFDVSDSKPVDDIIENIDLILTAFKGMNSVLKKEKSEIVKSIDDIAEKSVDLKVAIQQADETREDSHKTINTTIKLSKELVTAQEKNVDALGKNTKALEDNVKVTKKLKKSKDDLADSNEAETGSLESLKKELKEAEKAYAAMGDSVDKSIKDDQIKRVAELSKKHNDLKGTLNKAKKAVDTAKGSYNELNKIVLDGRKELKKMENGLEGNSQEFKQLKGEVASAIVQLKEWDKELGDNHRSVGDYGLALEGMGGAVNKAIGFLGPLGLAAAAGISADAIRDAVVELEKNAKVLSKLLKAGGKDLEVYAARATAVAQVFEQDFNEVAKAANVLMENLGLSGSEAFDIIEQSLIRGADINDDFLEQINEYSLFFHEAGLSAQNMVDVMIAGENKGIFSDKALDAVKEASIRIREMPQSTKDAIDALGISSNQLQKDLASGTKTVADAIAEVSEKMGELPEQSAVVGTAIADIFGGAGEDAGLAFLLTLKDINKETEDYTKTLSEGQKATKAMLDSQTNLNTELLGLGTSFDTTGKKIKAGFNNILAGTVNILSATIDAFRNTNDVLEDFTKQLQASSDVAILTKELNELKSTLDDPSAFDTFKKAFLGAISPSLIAKSIAEDVAKISLLEARITEIAQENADKQNDIDKKSAIEKKKTGEDLARAQRQAARDLFTFRLNNQIKLLEETKKNEEASITERISAADLIAEKQIQIAEISKAGQLDVEKALIAEQKTLINEQLDALVAEAEKTGEDFANALFESAKIAASEGDLSGLFSEAATIRLNEIEAAKNKELQIIEESDATLKEKAEQRLQVENEFNQKSLESELFFLKKSVELSELSAIEKSQTAKDISRIELELSKTTADKKIEDAQRVHDKLKELGAEAITLAIDFANQTFEQKIAEDEAEIARIDEQLARETELAGDNEERKAQLNEDANKKKDELQKKVNKEKRKQAKLNKIISIVEIAINTARGISQALGTFPPPASFVLAAITGVIGAAQIAAVASQKIPSFFKGTDNAPKGPAIINELGPELITDSSGKKRIINTDGPTFINLKGGEKITPADETKRELELMSSAEAFKQTTVAFNDGERSISIINDNKATEVMTRVLSDRFERLEHVIKNKRETHLIFKNGQLQEWTKENENWSRIVNESYA